MEGCRAGSRIIGPAAAEHPGKSVEQVKAAALDAKKPRREKRPRSQTDRDGGGDRGVRLDVDQR